jgi:hypothetical protein
VIFIFEKDGRFAKAIFVEDDCFWMEMGRLLEVELLV